MSWDPTNPEGARWFYTVAPVKAADTLAAHVDDDLNTVQLTFGQTVGNAIVEVASFIVQRDVAEAFGGSLLSLGNKVRPGE